jgi:hypothetical protein
VRDGLSRRDWDFFRPEEAIPRQVRNILAACMMSYKRIGIIRNIIDVMGEFTCLGVRLVHPNPRIQDLYQEWAKKVNFTNVLSASVIFYIVLQMLLYNVKSAIIKG